MRVSILRVKDSVTVDKVLAEFDSQAFLPTERGVKYEINGKLYVPSEQTILIGGNGDVEQVINAIEYDGRDEHWDL